ncbi:MAG: hypothetical protein ACYSWO_14760 [Planctomycetota bacterium]
MLRRLWLILLIVPLCVYSGCAAEKEAPIESTATAKRTGRLIVDLNGTWEIAEGAMDTVPESFGHTVPVPGLVDMAEPAFDEVGTKSQRRQAFWYRREFTVDTTIPDVALLKIHKAKYGTEVFLNGIPVGEHLPCFTPALLDVRNALIGEGERNELIASVRIENRCPKECRPAGISRNIFIYPAYTTRSN